MKFRCILLFVFVISCNVFSVPVTDGLMVHLDADSITGLNEGDAVTVWADSAIGDTVDGTVTSVSTGPTYVTQALNGHSVIRLNGTGASLMASASLTLPNIDDGLTVFVVATGDASGDGGERVMQFGLVGSNNVGKCLGVDFSTNTTGADGGSGARFNNGKALAKVNNPLTTGFHIAAMQMDQGDQYGALRYYVDNMDQETLDNTANPTNTLGLVVANNELTIGTGVNTSGAGYMSSDIYNGDIAEILVYNSQLTPAQMQDIFDYLYDRYFTENLIIHLDAESLANLNDGDTVSNWPDSADADTVDGTVWPVTGTSTYQTSVLNGNPVVRLDGTGYLASSLLTLPSIDNGLTMFIVATGDKSGASAERAVQLGQVSNNAGHTLGVDLSTNTADSDGGSGGRFNNGKSLVKAGNPITTDFHIAILQMGQSQTYSELKYYVDGLNQEVFNNTANPSNIFTLLSSDNKLTVGTGIDSSGGYYGSDIYQGDIAEIRIYNTQLSYSQMQTIFDSLYDRYLSSLIVVSPVLLDLTEGQSGTIDVFLDMQPADNVTIQLEDLFDPNQVHLDPTVLQFTPSDWDQPQTIQVLAVDDILLESQYHSTTILLASDSVDSNYSGEETSVRIDILENECGRWAYPQGDFNEDCHVNLYDFVVLADHWLWCDPMKDDLCMNLN